MDYFKMGSSTYFLVGYFDFESVTVYFLTPWNLGGWSECSLVYETSFSHWGEMDVFFFVDIFCKASSLFAG